VDQVPYWMLPQELPSVLREQLPVSVVVCGVLQPPAEQVKRVTVRVRVPVSSQALA